MPASEGRPATLNVLEADATADEVVAELAVNGGVIVRDLLASDVRAAFKDDIAGQVDGQAPGTATGGEHMAQFWGSETKRFTRLAWRSRAFEQILLAPMLMAVADRMLLPSCHDYWLNTGQMMVIGPGESAQMWHRDAGNWMAMCTPSAPEVTVSCMYAIDDFTADNGATRVIPGSQNWADYDQRPSSDSPVAVAEMNAGDGMIYTGRVIHAGGANVTAEEWRLGLHVSFVLGWLTPEEALPISVPRESAQQMSERAQRLLGWRSYGEKSRLWTVDYEEIQTALG